MAYIVFSGLVMLWRLAGCPTRISPSSVNATMDGVVRPPSEFSMTLALFPSITATQELVVPRSMPIAFAMTGLLISDGCALLLPSIRCGTRSTRRGKRHCVPQTLGGLGGLGLLVLVSGLGLLILVLSRGVFHLDFFRLRFGRLRNRDLQNSV